jgi:hypothetical protein
MDADLFKEITQAKDFTPSKKETERTEKREIRPLILNFGNNCLRIYQKLNLSKKLIIPILPLILLCAGGLIFSSNNKSRKLIDNISAIIPPFSNQKHESMNPTVSPTQSPKEITGTMNKPTETEENSTETNNQVTGPSVNSQLKPGKAKTTTSPIPKNNNNQISITANTSNPQTNGGNNSSKIDSSTRQTTPDLTDNWKTILNPTFGYTLRYPQDWFVKKIGSVGLTQATSFSTLSDPNEIVATFYIKISSSETNFSMQTGYKTSTYTTKNGKTYIYQCVHKLDEKIRNACDAMINIISFDN